MSIYIYTKKQDIHFSTRNTILTVLTVLTAMLRFFWFDILGQPFVNLNSRSMDLSSNALPVELACLTEKTIDNLAY